MKVSAKPTLQTLIRRRVIAFACVHFELVSVPLRGDFQASDNVHYAETAQAADIVRETMLREPSLLDCHANLDCERFTARPHDLATKNTARDFGGRLGNLALLDAFQ